jgi:hypothetical protein
LNSPKTEANRGRAVQSEEGKVADFADSPEEFVSDVVRPALTALSLDEDLSATTELLLGTALQESSLVHRVQLGGGPARGLFQMEPNTHDDIWANFLKFRPTLAEKIGTFLDGAAPNSQLLTNNDKYAAAMARIQYHRMGQIVGKAPIPERGDIPGMAAYWKDFYNTGQGAGSPAQFVANWESKHGAIA